MQEFKENTNEVLDHLSSDINSSQTALEKVLENQDNNKLEGRFVKIEYGVEILIGICI